MTRNKRGLWGVVLLGLTALACWLAALLTANALTQQYGGLSVRLPAASVTQRDLERAAVASSDGTLICAAAWSRASETKTASAALGANAPLRMIRVYGDMRQIAPMKLLSGSFPVYDDLTGCVVDAKSAWKLFHSIDAIGAQLTVDGNDYVVRGIVEAYEPMLLLRGSTEKYENLEFTVRYLLGAKQHVETFLYRCNSAGGEVVIESGLLARLIRGAVWLLPCLLGAVGAVALFKRGWMRRSIRRESLLLFLAGALLAAAVVVLLIKTAFWPQQFLPTKWSDFGFWSSLMGGWREQCKAISLITPLPKEIVFFQKARLCGILLLTAFLTAGWGTASGRFVVQRQKRDASTGL